MSCLRIQFDFNSACHIRRRRYRRTVAFCYLKRNITSAHCPCSDCRKCHLFSGLIASCNVSIEINLIHFTFQHLRCLSDDPLFQFLTGSCHRHTGHISRTWCIRAWIIRRSIGICSGYCNIIQITVQTFCCHLCKNRITPGSHVRCRDWHIVDTILAQFDRRRSDIYIGNAGSLHGKCYSDAADFAIRHNFSWILFIPSGHFFYSRKAFIKCTAIRCLPIICRHELSFFDHILHTDLHRIHAKFFCQFINRCLNRKDSLRRSISTISSCCHPVGIDHIVTEPVCI